MIGCNGVDNLDTLLDKEQSIEKLQQNEFNENTLNSLETKKRDKKRKIQQVIDIDNESKPSPEIEPIDVTVYPKVFTTITFSMPREQMFNMRCLNRRSYKILSGFEEICPKGVHKKPGVSSDIFPLIFGSYVDYRKLGIPKEPNTIPSFIFYQLLLGVNRLPREFWPFIKDTHIKNLDLSWMKIKKDEVDNLIICLKGSGVTSINLSQNALYYEDAEKFAALLNKNFIIIQSITLQGNRINEIQKNNLKKDHYNITWHF